MPGLLTVAKLAVRRLVTGDFDRTLAIAGLALSILLTIVLVMTENGEKFLFIGLIGIGTCLIWLRIRPVGRLTCPSLSSRALSRASAALFFLLLSAATLLVYLNAETHTRPPVFFLIVAVMAGLLGVQVIADRRGSCLPVLFQTIILGLLLYYSQHFLFPTVFGLDPWWHQSFTTRIASLFHVPQGEAYSYIPVFHVLIAMTMNFINLPFKEAATISANTFSIVAPVLFCYLIGRFCFKSVWIGALAGVFVTAASSRIGTTILQVPNGFTVLLIPVVIYLLLRSRNTDRRLIGLAYLLLITILWSHSIAAVMTAVTLWILELASVIHNRLYGSQERFVPYGTAAFFSAAILVWWWLASGTLSQVFIHIQHGFGTTPEEIMAIGLEVPVMEFVVNNIGAFLFFAAAMIGVFWASSQEDYHIHAVVLCGFAPFAFGMFSFLTGLDLLPSRWWSFAQLLLAIPLAAAVCIVGTRSRRVGRFTLGAAVFITILAALMIIQPIANVDNQFLSPNTSSREAYTESEMSAAAFLTGHLVSRVSSDYNFAMVPTTNPFKDYFGMSQTNTVMLDHALANGTFNRDGTLVIIRSEIADHTFKLIQVYYRLPYDPDAALQRDGFDKIFSSNGASGYL